MKINKSIVYFNTSIKRRPDGSKYTIANTPYWKLYCKSDNKLTEPYSYRSLTYNEVLNIVRACDSKKIFTAYPRITRIGHTVLEYDYVPATHELIIFDKHTGEVLFVFNAICKEIIYCNNATMRSYYKRKFCIKENGKEILSPLAEHLYNKL